MRLRDKPRPIKVAVGFGAFLILVGICLLVFPEQTAPDSSSKVTALLAALDLSIGFLVAFYINGIVQPNPHLNRQAQYVAIAITSPLYVASIAILFL